MPISSHFSRRRLLASGGVAGAFMIAGIALAAQAADTDLTAKLMAPQALPDVVLGAANAPVTIVEYASMTCPHCARFHANTFPTLKSKYIDTGKVRFMLREFPLDQFAAAGFMLARCTGSDEKRTAMIDLLFATQQTWAYGDNPVDGLASVVKQAGITKDGFESCLKNKDLYDKVNAEADLAGKQFGVKGTPTFFFNGKQEGNGEMSVEDLEKILDPLLKSK